MPQPQPISQEDRGFLPYAAEDNQAEIGLYLIAEKKARSPAIKAFARLMVGDHVQIESRLAAVAEADNAPLPGGVAATYLGSDGGGVEVDLELAVPLPPLPRCIR